MGKQWKQYPTLFFGAPKSLQTVTAAMKLKDACSLRKSMTNLDSILKSGDITLPWNVCLVKAMVFPVVKYGCESWTIKKAEHQKYQCFWTVELEKTLESPLDCKEIQPINPKGNRSWIFIGKTWCWSSNSNTLATWWKNWLIGKDPDSGKDWRREEKGTIEDEMIG